MATEEKQELTLKEIRGMGRKKARAANLRAKAAKLKLRASRLEVKANQLKAKVKEYEEMAYKLDRY